MNQDWLFLSKNNQDEYINMLAQSAGVESYNSDNFDFHYDIEVDRKKLVLRGILKYKIMHRCWEGNHDFWYVDSGYMGNNIGAANPRGIKLYHRIVKNDLQHQEIHQRPADRWSALGIKSQPRRHGRRIIVAAPDEKPCRFYGIDQKQWINDTVTRIKQLTDRPVEVRQRAHKRIERVATAPLSQELANDVHALVTFNSIAAVESILAGVPAFVLAPTHVAAPVANISLDSIEDPVWADRDLIDAWCHSMAYGQYHVTELQNGKAFRMMQE
jgi:hypothetical protein